MGGLYQAARPANSFSIITSIAFIMETGSQNTPYTNLSAEVQNALSELNADNTKYEPQNAAELLRLENSVQIFFVTSDGRVSTFSAPETLRIFQFSQDQADSTSTFLQVGGWTHPLIPGASPCLQAENGALMFPDIYSDLPDCSVGLVLTDGISEEIRSDLVNLLAQHTALKSQALLPPDQRLGSIGSAIVKGAEYLAQGIEIGAEKAGDLIEYVTDKSQKKLSKAEEDAKIGSLTKGSISAAKSATTATVKVSGYVANRVGKLTKSMAGYLAAKAEKPISGVVSTTKGGDKKQGTMAYLIDAARGGLIAYGTVYTGLESSAKVLSHKYGGDAGHAFGDACTAAGNAAMTYMNIQSLGVKGLVKKTAKETGKTVAKNVITGESKKSVTNEPAQV